MALIIHYVTYSCCLRSSTNIGQIGSDSPSQSQWVPNLSVPLGVSPLVYERKCPRSGLAKRADGIYPPDTPCRRESSCLRITKDVSSPRNWQTISPGSSLAGDKMDVCDALPPLHCLPTSSVQVYTSIAGKVEEGRKTRL